jgi:hypothetical protein
MYGLRMWTDLVGWKQGPLADCCKYGVELSASVKDEEILTNIWSTVSFTEDSPWT